MSEISLQGKKVAILVANGFEELHMTDLQKALMAAGAVSKVVSPEPGLVNGWHEDAWGHYFPIDVPIADVLSADYDMLLVPGGQRSVDKLAASAHARRIVTGFIDAQKPVALLGEAPALLAVVDRAAGRRVSAFGPAVEKLTQAGALISTDLGEIDGALLTAIGPVDDFAPVVPEVLYHFAHAAGMADAA